MAVPDRRWEPTQEELTGMDRRGFLRSTGCGAGALAAGMAGGQAAERPNILFITVDDMSWDSVGAFGCTVPDITPNMDRLAAEGIRFEHAHLNIAVCQPCRESITTGRYPHRSGGEGFEPIHEDVPTLSEQLGPLGYLNGIMGKSGHYAPVHRYFWDVRVLPRDLGSGREPRAFAAYGRDFLRRAKEEGRPFLLHANTADPHRPFPGSQQLANKKPQQRAAYPGVSRTYRPEEVTVPGFLPDIPDVREEVAQYFTAVHRADETVGGLLGALEDTGLAGNTIVLLLSDNGMAFPFGKTNVYNASTRTPLMIRWPGKVAPKTVDRAHMVSGIDIMPTLLEAVGAPRVEGMDGRSFLPALDGRIQEGRDRIFSVFHETSASKRFEMRCVRSKEWAYIHNAWSDGETVFRNESQSGLTMKAMQEAAETDEVIAARVKHFLYRAPEELYDFRDDPLELTNLVDEPGQGERVSRGRGELAAWMDKTGDALRVEYAQYLRGIEG